MLLPHSEQLDISHFSRRFDNKSECYKLFWFQAIVTKIMDGRDTVSFEELIHEMIADAWYMVTEYHLNLGPSDNLERIVTRLAEISEMKPSVDKKEILRFLETCDDKAVRNMKRDLSLNVPYRLQAPFMESMKERKPIRSILYSVAQPLERGYKNYYSIIQGKEWSRSGEQLVRRINRETRLMYYFDTFDQLSTRIILQPE